VAVEIDPPFAALTESVVNTHFAINEGRMQAVGAKREHVRLLSGDVLDGKNSLNPVLLKSVRDVLALSGTKRVKLVANLPYAVAVPVLSNLLLTDLPVERMVGMIQWELAERLMAAPSTKEYGALAVLVQSLATVELVRKVPPTVFHPRPKVDSAIVLIRPDPAKRAHVGDVRQLRNFLRDVYVHRRKNLRGALSTMPSGKLDKAEVDARLAKLGIDGAARAESLGLEDHLRLAQEFGTATPEDA
ncbi:MAG: hypothetical protein K2W96_12480, partial [Gemmataceae bacterium]|nr:hypothetical protein [Gemmataceae bacterium]